MSAILARMAWGQAKHGIFRRAIIACAVLSVFSLQLATLVGSARAAEASGLSSFSESVAGLCNASGEGGDSSHDGRDPAKCCGACLASARASSLLAFVAVYAVAANPAPIARTLFLGWERREDRPLPERLNNWASRAPPSFS
jgi:hypothetical protein